MIYMVEDRRKAQVTESPELRWWKRAQHNYNGIHLTSDTSGASLQSVSGAAGFWRCTSSEQHQRCHSNFWSKCCPLFDTEQCRSRDVDGFMVSSWPQQHWHADTNESISTAITISVNGTGWAIAFKYNNGPDADNASPIFVSTARFAYIFFGRGATTRSIDEYVWKLYRCPHPECCATNTIQRL